MAPIVIHFRGGQTRHVELPPTISTEDQMVRVASEEGGQSVGFASLKAIFYLRDENSPLEPLDLTDPRAISLVVEFQDGEKIRGTSFEYGPLRPGFLVYPSDRTKNDRVYVVTSAVVSIEVEPA